MEYYIYGLSSSENGIIRYIGQTKNALKNRLNEHKCDALTRNLKSHKCNWIRKIYKSGFKLQIELIEKTDELHWQEREIYWIQEYRKKFENKLINQLDGGQCGGIGGQFFPYSYDETKEKIKELELSFRNFKDYKEYVKEHQDLKKFFPLNPKKVFSARKEWVSWGDFLSTQYVSDKEKHDMHVPYEDAKRIVNQNKISSIKDYRKFYNEKIGLPMYPERTYKNKGWTNWFDFLGNKKIIKCDYNTFCRYISIYFSSGITKKEYEHKLSIGELSKRLPYHPERNYGKSLHDIIKEVLVKKC